MRQDLIRYLNYYNNRCIMVKRKGLLLFFTDNSKPFRLFKLFEFQIACFI